MTTPRERHTATLLTDGRVLVAGGFQGRPHYGSLASSEIYDPLSETWASTGSMGTSRIEHTATRLLDGRVLVAGGFRQEIGMTQVLSSAEIYDPASGTWAPTGSMGTARFEHTATLLPDGRVLVAGGFKAGSIAGAEIYDPVSETWASTGSMGAARTRHSASLLSDGRVLVAGGAQYHPRYASLASAEIYDPVSETWASTGSMGSARSAHTASHLADGRVLVVGGWNYGHGFLASAEIYDPASRTWSPTDSMAKHRDFHTATILADGTVLVVGGSNGRGVLATAEVYASASGTWASAGKMVNARYLHTATPLLDGRVLVAGGNNPPVGYLASAEIANH
jgi:N-acetylneuraminic acid mutarotase